MPQYKWNTNIRRKAVEAYLSAATYITGASYGPALALALGGELES